jgi:hypothetical protein
MEITFCNLEKKQGHRVYLIQNILVEDQLGKVV